MQLKNYISNVLENLDVEDVITFDIGIDTNMEVNDTSLNRIKFSCKKKQKKENIIKITDIASIV